MFKSTRQWLMTGVTADGRPFSGTVTQLLPVQGMGVCMALWQLLDDWSLIPPVQSVYWNPNLFHLY